MNTDEQITSQEYHKEHPIADAMHGLKKEAMSAMSGFSSSESWYQPRKDAQGTVKGCSKYGIECAKEDAIKLRKAMNESGTDKGLIVDICGCRTFEQRRMIAQEYCNLDEREKRCLLKDLKNDLGGDLGQLVECLFNQPGEIDARIMEKAMRGIGTNADLLNEVLCTRTNDEIIEMKKGWQDYVDNKQKLEDRVSDETKKFFGVSHYNTLCLKLLQANRPNPSTPDEKLVFADAHELNRLLLERSNVNNVEGKFVEVFTERSWPHIACLANKFESVSHKWTLEGAIKEGFGNSNDGKALLTIEEFCRQPYDFWAKKLRDAMSGFTTDDSALIRIIVSRSEIDLANVVQVFGQHYGDGKTLRSWLEDKTSGYYCQLLLKLCGYF